MLNSMVANLQIAISLFLIILVLRNYIRLHHLLQLFFAKLSELALLDIFLLVLLLNPLIHLLLAARCCLTLVDINWTLLLLIPHGRVWLLILWVLGSLVLVGALNRVVSRGLRVTSILLLILNNPYILRQVLPYLPQLANLLLQHLPRIRRHLLLLLLVRAPGRLIHHHVADHLKRFLALIPPPQPVFFDEWVPREWLYHQRWCPLDRMVMVTVPSVWQRHWLASLWFSRFGDLWFCDLVGDSGGLGIIILRLLRWHAINSSHSTKGFLKCQCILNPRFLDFAACMCQNITILQQLIVRHYQKI